MLLASLPSFHYILYSIRIYLKKQTGGFADVRGHACLHGLDGFRSFSPCKGDDLAGSFRPHYGTSHIVKELHVGLLNVSLFSDGGDEADG